MKFERAKNFEDFIEAEEFPCVVGKAALKQENISFFHGVDIRSAEADERLHDELVNFGAALNDDEKVFQSLVAIYETPLTLTEAQFEEALWARLNALHELDIKAGIGWAPSSSADPKSDKFSISIGGQAYFIIGLHPGASRRARRFASPVLVFNSHDKFEALRKAGMFDKIRTTIREREARFSDQPNEMLSDYGEISEARQYSGRAVPDDWECPFQRLKATEHDD